jgi:uncharacterized protein YeaO (DUF488 family)
MSSKTKGRLQVKRIYEPKVDDDGFRVLVDRLWPRGMSKAKAHIDLWLKDVAPSDALRHRLHDDPSEWESFLVDYAHELKQEPAVSAVATLREHLKHGPVTLLYAAHDEAHNNAVALKRLLEKSSK